MKEKLKGELKEELMEELKEELKEELEEEVKQELKEELKEELKKESSQTEKKIQENVAQLLKMNDSLEQINLATEEIDQMSRTVKLHNIQIQQACLHLKDIKIKLDGVEQKFYENEVQLVGLSESQNGLDDKKKVVQLAKEKMGLDIKDSIEEVYRLGRKSNRKPRDLIVKFTNKETREAFYSKRKNSVQSKYPNQNIYVNDHITEYRKELFYAARKLYRAK